MVSSIEGLCWVVQGILPVPEFVRILHKFLFSCEFTIFRLFILVMLIGTGNAIYPEIVLGQRFSLSGVYLHYNHGLVPFPAMRGKHKPVPRFVR